MSLTKTVAFALPLLAVLATPAFAQPRQMSGEITYLNPNRLTLEKQEGLTQNLALGETTLVFRGKTLVDTQELLMNQWVHLLAQDQEHEPFSSVPSDTETYPYASDTGQLGELFARAILIVDNETVQQQIYVNTFTQPDNQAYLLSESGRVRLPLDTDAVIYDSAGATTDYALADVAGRELAIIYGELSGYETGIPSSPHIFVVDAAPAQPAVSPQLPSILSLLPYLNASLPLPHELKDFYATDTASDLVTTPPKVMPVGAGGSFLSQLPWWAGGTLTASKRVTPPGNAVTPLAPSVSPSQEAPSDEVSEFLDELIEDIIDESYYTGLEILIEDSEITIEINA